MKTRRYLKSFYKSRRGERGATAVEFALVAPVFLMFMLGIIDLGRLFWVKSLMEYSVGQTARFAMVNPSTSQAALEQYATDEISTLMTGITFVADAAGTDVETGLNADGTTNYTVTHRTITATYTFSFMMPLVAIDDLDLSSSTRTPVNE